MEKEPKTTVWFSLSFPLLHRKGNKMAKFMQSFAPFKAMGAERTTLGKGGSMVDLSYNAHIGRKEARKIKKEAKEMSLRLGIPVKYRTVENTEYPMYSGVKCKKKGSI